MIKGKNVYTEAVRERENTTGLAMGERLRNKEIFILLLVHNLKLKVKKKH